MRQVAESAKLLQGFSMEASTSSRSHARIATRAGLRSEVHQIEVGRDEMLRSRIVQFLRDALALLLLKVDEALGQLLRLLFQHLALGDIRNHPDQTPWLARIGELSLSINLQPTLQPATGMDTACDVEVAAVVCTASCRASSKT